jgi:hypothetical protein
MFSTTIERSVAALGVVAGLLAAAAPASASTASAVSALRYELYDIDAGSGDDNVKAESFFGGLGNDTLDTGAGADAARSGVVTDNNDPGFVVAPEFWEF